MNNLHKTLMLQQDAGGLPHGAVVTATIRATAVACGHIFKMF